MPQSAIIVMATTIMVALLPPGVFSNTGPKFTPCTSDACTWMGKELSDSIDQTVSPCDDFYQFACGGWMKSNPVPQGMSYWTVVHQINSDNIVAVRAILENKTFPLANDAEDKVRRFYTSCIDPEGIIQQQGPKPLLALLKKLGAWATGSGNRAWNISYMQNILTTAHRLGTNALFSMSVVKDAKDPTRNIIQFDQGSLTMDVRLYANDSLDDANALQAYSTFITRVLVLLGLDQSLANSIASNVVQLEQKLAAITTPSDLLVDPEKLYNKMTLADLDSKTLKMIQFTKLVNVMLIGTRYSVHDMVNVVVKEPDYMTGMASILSQYWHTKTGKTTLLDFIRWQVVYKYIPYLSAPFLAALDDLHSTLTGAFGGTDTSARCLTETKQVLGFALGAIFVRNRFASDSKRQVEKIFTEVTNKFTSNFATLSWMDRITLTAAMDKASGLTKQIGYPDDILDARTLNNAYMYGQLQITSKDYFNNSVNSVRLALRRNMLELTKPVDNNKWIYAPLTVNAFLSDTGVKLMVPAGLLQPPIYNRDFPAAVNYATAGSFIANEICHTFDETGSKFDKNGVLNSWWSPATSSNYEKAASCIQQQYDAYPNVDGTRTLTENIADNAGVKTALQAYYDHVSSQTAGDDTTLPGLNYTPPQLFFLSYAHMMCATITPQAANQQAASDVHAANKYRVNGVVSNSAEFAKQFSCSPSSKMNPPKKCSVW